MQGDISSAIDEMVKKLQVNTAASANSQQMIERYVQDVIDTYNDAIAQKEEMYRWDAKNESLWGYFKRVQKQKEKIYKERQKNKDRIQFLGEQINLYKEKENDAIANHKNELGQALFKRRVQLEIEKDIKEAMDDVTSSVESGAKSGNPYLAAIMVVGGLIISAAKMLFNVAVSIVKIGFSFLQDVLGVDMGIGAVYRRFLEMQKLVGKVSADSGLLASESKGFLNQMPTIMNEVLDVGGSIEQVGEAYEGYNKLTNRNRVFSGVEFKSIIELGLGTGLGVSAAGELIGNFENLGYSLDRTLKFTDFVRQKSMAVSQNQTTVLKKTNELITELTGFNIEKGLEGMVKLVLKTQKARIDVKKSVGAFKDAFTDPETAVDAAATARLLGGKFATYFSDPFMLMAKSIEDPLQLTADLMEVVKGKAFKGRNGFEILPADRELIREFATTMNQDADELFSAAIEDAKYTDKIEALRKKGIKTFGLTDEENELLTNLMTLNEDGSYSIRLSNGVVQRLSETPSNSEIYGILKQERKNAESALLRKTLAERLTIVLDRFTNAFSQVFVELNNLFNNHNTIGDIQDLAKDISTNMIDFIHEIFSEKGNFRQAVLESFTYIKGIFHKLFDIWMDPKKELGQKISESGGLIFSGFKDKIIPYLQYVAGVMIEGLGGLFLSDSMKGAGLKMKSKGVLSGGEDSFLAKEVLPGLIEDIKVYNGAYADDIEDKIDLNKLTDLQKKIDEANKKASKAGKTVKAIDTIQTPSFMNYGQNTSNVSVPFKVNNSLAAESLSLLNQPNPIVFANGKILQGRKDDAVLFFDEKANQIASVKKPIVKLNLTGTIDMTQHDLDDDGVKNATNIVSKQIINQMVYNA
jgi:hypothetical protein